MSIKDFIIIAIPYNIDWFLGGNFFFHELIQSYIKFKSNNILFKLFSPEELFNKDEYDAIFSIRGTFFEYYFPRIKKIKKPIFLYHDDMHRYLFGFPLAARDQLEYLEYIKLYFTPYISNIFNFKSFKQFYNKFYSLPWSVPDRLVEGNFDLNWSLRINSVVLSGMINKIYPLRKYLFKQAKNKITDNIVLLNHPGYQSNENGLVGFDYYNFLMKYKGAITTTAYYPINYTVMKYFEVPACGCIGFFQNTPDLNNLGFVDMVNCILIDNKNYKDKLNILNSNVNIETIACRGFNLIKLLHKHSDRIKEVSNVILENL